MLPAFLVALCVLLRVVPHPPNFAPVGATAVFAGRTLRPGAAMGLVAVSMLVADALLARIHGYAMLSLVTPFIYGGFLVQVLLGRWLRGRRGGALGAAGLGACAFFMLSNLGVWAASGMYAPDASGLFACYVAALPFFALTLLGDVVWTLILTAAYRPLADRLKHRPRWVPAGTQELPVV